MSIEILDEGAIISGAAGAPGGTGNGSVILFGASSIDVNSTANRFLFVGGDVNHPVVAPGSQAPFRAPRSGTVRNLAVTQVKGGKDSKSAIFYTIVVNNSPTSLLVVIANDSTTTLSNFANSAPVLQGQTIELKAVAATAVGANNSPSPIIASVQFE